ncbi:MAG: hypothetical protein VR64_19110 [Desulfatitalea sp. BRH_c12]|jgi:hypothetical protein|nr:MAG: hypothetical protein VR64_19110 [Desulfatitalea sp. BRH_c12]
MKNLIILYIMFMFAMFIGTTGALADQEYEYIEMADGAYARFEVNSGSTHSKSQKDSLPESSGQSVEHMPEKWMEPVEMADGAYTEFPMSEKEIQFEKRRRSAEIAHNSLLRETEKLKPQYCRSLDIVEMADGRIVAFGRLKETPKHAFNPVDCLTVAN